MTEEQFTTLDDLSEEERLEEERIQKQKGQPPVSKNEKLTLKSLKKQKHKLIEKSLESNTNLVKLMK